MASQISVRPAFIDGRAGRLFVLDYRPAGKLRGDILFVPPFAEEMNCSRRMVALQARRFARAGYRTIVPDLYGTGDSDGDFADATWSLWKHDLETVRYSLAEAGSDAPAIVWSLRLGAILAADAINDGRLEASRLLLWSPCLDGSVFLRQFLRLRLMAAMIANGGKSETVEHLKAQLDAGESLEVAGYELSAVLAREIERARLQPLLAGRRLPVDWYEMVLDASRPFPPGPARAASALAAAGLAVRTIPVPGPLFWSTPEIATPEALLDATDGATGKSADDHANSAAV